MVGRAVYWTSFNTLKNSENSMAGQPGTQPETTPMTRTWLSFFRLLIGGFALLMIVLIPVARWFYYELDHAMANVMTMLLLCLFSVATFVWLILTPRIGILRRALILALPAVLITGFVNLFEFRGFSGEMIPIFKRKV